MIDIQLLRQNPREFKQNLQARQIFNLDETVDEIFGLDQQRLNLIQAIEDLRARQNQITAEIGAGAKKELIQSATQIKKQIQQLSPRLGEIENQLQDRMRRLPNWQHAQVPIGKDESENQVLREWGQPTQFNFPPQDHVAIGEKLDLIDIPTSARVSGQRFNYLKNEAVLLQFALVKLVFRELTNAELIAKLAKKVGNPSGRPFTPIVPPVMVKAEIAKKMDRFDPIEERYYFPQDDLLLVGSAEHTLGPMLMDQILDEAKLPIRLIGYSTAFRREAGSYGKDTQGILRRHQFDKLEMETFTTVENGEKEQDLIVALQEHFVQLLGIPYQVVQICSGDMGKPDYRQIDINCWLPGQDKYRETHTSDYMTDFQARRLNIRYRSQGGTSQFVHMNDATALAIGRILIAILENYQQADGSVLIPEVLQADIGTDRIQAR